MEVLAHLPQGPGVGDNDQVFYGPVQAELVQERGGSCREAVLEKSAFAPWSVATATRSSSVSCIDLVISLMCADQNASGVCASSASSAARNASCCP